MKIFFFSALFWTAEVSGSWTVLLGSLQAGTNTGGHFYPGGPGIARNTILQKNVIISISSAQFLRPLVTNTNLHMGKVEGGAWLVPTANPQAGSAMGLVLGISDTFLMGLLQKYHAQPLTPQILTFRSETCHVL